MAKAKSRSKKGSRLNRFASFLGTKQGKVIPVVVLLVAFGGIGTYFYQQSHAATGYSAWVTNHSNSAITTTLSSTVFTDWRVYLSRGQSFRRDCNGSGDVDRFYTHSGYNVRLNGNFIVGNGVTESYNYNDTGWHKFPSRFISCDTDVTMYEYRQ
jgi:hypothetical protein